MFKPGAGQDEDEPEDQAADPNEHRNCYQKHWIWPAATILLLGPADRALAIDADSVNSWRPTQPYSWTDVVLVGITALYLIVTAIYAAISYAQWGVLRKTLEETRHSNALTLRAWLSVESIDLAPNPIGQAELYVKVTARNIGKLPATSVTVTLLPKIDRYIDPLSFAQGREIHFVIAAGHTETFPFLIKDFPEAGIQRLRAGTFGLRVIADLQYTDALVTKGHTIQPARYLHPRPEEALPERLFLDPDGTEME